MSRPVRLWLPGVVICCLVAVFLVLRRPAGDEAATEVGDAAEAAPVEVSESHARMIEALEQVRQQSLVSDQYFQTESVAVREQELAMLPATGSEQRRFELLMYLADDYRRLDKIELAIERMLEAEELLQTSDLRLSPEGEENVPYEMGLTFLRQGETENCVHCRSGESCILPIQGAGVHQKQSGSRTAMKFFQQVLERNPDHLRARWLLNVAAMTVGEFPGGVPEAQRIAEDQLTSPIDFPVFRDVARDIGLRTVSCGGGAIAEDFDNDGLIDIFTSTWDPGGQARYFRNTGAGEFLELTEHAGLVGIVGGINCVQGDFDNDGRTDIFMVRGAWLGQNGRHPNSLLRNLGGGRFEDVTFELGLGHVHYPSSTAAWADFDLDGDLDLYVGNEGPACQLFRNDGSAGFVDIAASAGVTNDKFTKGVTWGDFNGDRRPDLYVSNLTGINRLYQNNGDGTFRDVAGRLGVSAPYRSFPTWFWDVNNDGHLDLYVGSYEGTVEHVAAEYVGRKPNTDRDRLYVNDGQGGFRDATEEFGLTGVTQPMGCNFGDLDNDGYVDFYLGTGSPPLDSLMPNLMFHNVQGQSFKDVSLPGGFAHLQKGHGTAFADLDNDGDQDVFMQMGGAYPVDAFGDVMYANPGFGNHWVRVRLTGTTSNRSGIGARIKVSFTDQGQQRTVFKWVNSGGSFGSNPLQQQIGVGQAQTIASLEVYWPASDTTQVFSDLPINSLVEIEEGSSRIETSELQTFRFQAGDGS